MFRIGIAVGVVGTRVVVRRVMQQAVAHPERVQMLMERNLTRRLRLDGDQQAKLHAILSDSHAQLEELRGKYRPELNSILGHANEQITAILTPEQQARFEQWKKDRPLLRAPLLRAMPRRNSKGGVTQDEAGKCSG